MRKKITIIVAIIFVIICIGLLSACSNQVNIYKKTYQDIVSANSNYYVVMEDGKYKAYNTKKHKEVFDESYDSVDIIEDRFGNTSYFLVGNIGDIGKSIINSSGNVILESTADKKIERAVLISSTKTNDNGDIYNTDPKALYIGCKDANNKKIVILCDLNGRQVSGDGSAILPIVNSFDNIGEYFCMLNIDTDETLLAVNIFNEELENLYSRDFSKENNGNYSFSNSNNSLEVNYVENEKTFYDLITPYGIYTGYSNNLGIKVIVGNEGNNENFYLYEKEDGTCDLISNKKAEIVVSFVSDYITAPVVNGDIIEVVNKNGDKVAYDFEGNQILRVYSQYYSYYNYFKTDTTNNIIYTAINGETIYTDNTADFSTVTFTPLYINEFLVLENTAGVVNYNFYNKNVLMKSYSSNNNIEYKEKDSDGFYYFNLLDNNEAVSMYSYNYKTNTEYVYNYDNTGILLVDYIYDNGDKVVAYVEGETEINFCIEDNSSTLFNECIDTKVEPFKIVDGLYPSFYDKKCNNDLSITILPNNLSTLNNKQEKIYLSVYHISFSLYSREQGADDFVYKNTGKMYHAYYVSDGKNGVNEIASGYAEFDISSEIISFSNYKKASKFIYMASTELDNFEDTVWQKPQTKLFNIKIDDSGFVYIEDICVIDKANAEFNKGFVLTENVLNHDIKGIYNYKGEEILGELYRINDFNNKLAVVSRDKEKVGIYDLEKGKLIEDCKYEDIKLYNDGFYSIIKINDYNSSYTLKYVKNGKKFADDILSITLINLASYNADKGYYETIYKIQTNSGYKLLTVSGEDIFSLITNVT
ncbi:MAG: hypothetical protein WCR54_02940 [Clostridia bacterium]